MEDIIVKTTLIINCEVTLNDIIKKQAEVECSKTLSDEEAAKRIFFSFINPKIEALNDEGIVTGHWDMVCEFQGRLKNFELIYN